MHKCTRKLYSAVAVQTKSIIRIRPLTRGILGSGGGKYFYAGVLCYVHVLHLSIFYSVFYNSIKYLNMFTGVDLSEVMNICSSIPISMILEKKISCFNTVKL